jgi:hypothetical protein
MHRIGWIVVVCVCIGGLGGLAGFALAGERAIDGVPVERVTITDVKASERPVTVSKITGTRLGDLTVACHGANLTCTVESSDHPRVEVLRTSLSEPPKTNTTLSIQIKVDDQMATVSVMWEDCRAC